MPVIEQERFFGLSEAVDLFFYRLLETLSIRSKGQHLRELRRSILNLVCVVLLSSSHAIQIPFNPLLLKGSHVQLRVGTNEDPRPASNSGAERVETSAR